MTGHIRGDARKRDHLTDWDPHVRDLIERARQEGAAAALAEVERRIRAHGVSRQRGGGAMTGALVALEIVREVAALPEDEQ